jgi:hypothetical protein
MAVLLMALGAVAKRWKPADSLQKTRIWLVLSKKNGSLTRQMGDLTKLVTYLVLSTYHFLLSSRNPDDKIYFLHPLTSRTASPQEGRWVLPCHVPGPRGSEAPVTQGVTVKSWYLASPCSSQRLFPDPTLILCATWWGTSPTQSPHSMAPSW